MINFNKSELIFFKFEFLFEKFFFAPIMKIRSIRLNDNLKFLSLHHIIRLNEVLLCSPCTHLTVRKPPPSILSVFLPCIIILLFMLVSEETSLIPSIVQVIPYLIWPARILLFMNEGGPSAVSSYLTEMKTKVSQNETCQDDYNNHLHNKELINSVPSLSSR